jgi:hypothetical protein
MPTMSDKPKPDARPPLSPEAIALIDELIKMIFTHLRSAPEPVRFEVARVVIERLCVTPRGGDHV